MGRNATTSCRIDFKNREEDYLDVPSLKSLWNGKTEMYQADLLKCQVKVFASACESGSLPIR
jgi:hypothetical protein